MAAGITLARDNLGAFRAFLEDALLADVERARAASAVLVDGALTASGATTDLVGIIEQAGPYGQGNPEPVFALASQTLAFADAAGGGHLRLRLKAADGAMLDAIAFRAIGQPLGDALLARRGGAVHVTGTLNVDRWGGRERVQLRVLDAAAPI